jgi:predicted metal-dependent peptidase
MPEASALYTHRGTPAVQRMVEFAPSTGGLALWVRHYDLPSGGDGPMISTDGNAVYYSDAFERLSLSAQTGLVAHEVLHIALRHPQRFLDLQRVLGDVDLDLFNICADAIVNSTLSHLTWLRLPASAVMLDRLLADALDLKQNAETSLLEWDVERLYREIDDRRTKEQDARRQTGKLKSRGTPASRGGSGGRSPDTPSENWHRAAESRQDGPRAARVRMLGANILRDLAPDPEAEGPPEAAAEQAREWSERILRAHAGDGEFSMLRALIADLPKSRTPWEQVLRTRLARGLARKPDISWSRPARSYIANQGRSGPGRRLPWEPGFTVAKRTPRLVVVVDVSGSIADDLMQAFAREIEAITRRQEASLVLVIGDDRVRKVERFEPGRSDLREIEFEGAGGTDFTPLLEEAEKHRPDIAVVLTDLEGPARFRPRFPVIWAVPETYANAVAPFGSKLILR